MTDDEREAEIEAVALAIAESAGHASTASYARRLAEAAIVTLDRVRHEAEFEAQRKDAAASAESDEFVRRYRYGF